MGCLQLATSLWFDTGYLLWELPGSHGGCAWQACPSSAGGGGDRQAGMSRWRRNPVAPAVGGNCVAPAVTPMVACIHASCSAMNGRGVG